MAEACWIVCLRRPAPQNEHPACIQNATWLSTITPSTVVQVTTLTEGRSDRWTSHIYGPAFTWMRFWKQILGNDLTWLETLRRQFGNGSRVRCRSIFLRSSSLWVRALG